MGMLEWMHKAGEPGVMLPVSLLVSLVNALPPDSPDREKIVEYLKDYDQQTIGKGIAGVVAALAVTEDGCVYFDNALYEHQKATKQLNEEAPRIRREVAELARRLDKFAERERRRTESHEGPAQAGDAGSRLLSIERTLDPSTVELAENLQSLAGLLERMTRPAEALSKADDAEEA